jgi:mRNA interferase YafQ
MRREKVAADVNEPGLRTHPLAGELDEAMACSCGYDCRIVFRVVTSAKDKTREIILLNVGTHDEVY